MLRLGRHGFRFYVLNDLRNVWTALSQLFGRQRVKLMRKDQPFGRLVQVEVGNQIRFVTAGFEPRHGDTYVLRRIAARARGKLIDDGGDRIAGVEDIIDDQYAIIMTYLFDNVVEAVYGNGAALVHTDIRRGADGNVIGFDAAIAENLLHRHSDGRSASPYRDNHGGSKAAFEDIDAEFDRVLEEILGGEYGFVHCYSLLCGLLTVVIMRGSILAQHGSGTTKMNERFIAADDLLTDSFQLAANIFEDGFRPDFLVGLWRGGSAVGIAVQEGLDYFGVPTDHIALRTSYSGAPGYAQMVRKADSIRVHGMKYLHEKLCARHSMLIVDDVYSTGSSVKAVIDQLAKKTRRNMPQDIRIATVWYRPTEKTLQTPEYFVHETDDWLVLPYEMSGFTIDELRENRPEMAGLFDRLAPHVRADDKPAAR